MKHDYTKDTNRLNNPRNYWLTFTKIVSHKILIIMAIPVVILEVQSKSFDCIASVPGNLMHLYHHADVEV